MTRIYQQSLPLRTETHVGMIGEHHALIVANTIATINDRDQPLTTHRFIATPADIDQIIQQVEIDPFVPKVDRQFAASEFHYVYMHDGYPMNRPLDVLTVKDGFVYSSTTDDLITPDDIGVGSIFSSIAKTLGGNIVLPEHIEYDYVSILHEDFSLDNGDLRVYEAEKALRTVVGITASVVDIPYYNAEPGRDRYLRVQLDVAEHHDAIANAAKQVLEQEDDDTPQHTLSSIAFNAILSPLLTPFVKSSAKRGHDKDKDR